MPRVPKLLFKANSDISLSIAAEIGWKPMHFLNSVSTSLGAVMLINESVSELYQLRYGSPPFVYLFWLHRDLSYAAR